MRPCRLTRLGCCLWLLLFGTGLLAAPVVTSQLVWSVGLEQATAVAVTMTGQVYVLDGVNRRVRVLAANGTLSRTLEPGLTNALDIGASDGEGVLWIADTGNHRLLRFAHQTAWQPRNTLKLPDVQATDAIPFHVWTDPADGAVWPVKPRGPQWL